jgi:site-specific recombinase XerC
MRAQASQDYHTGEIYRMINRGNWKLVKSYLKYREEVDQVSPKTIRLEETWSWYLLDWANEKPFDQVSKIRPTLPEYMLTARKDGEKGQLSPIYIRKVISTGKRFFEWISKHRPGYSGIITPGWLDTVKSPRLESDAKEHEAVTIEEMFAVASAPVYSLRDRRIQAAACFWFLSGIRIGAFVTLPILAVNLEDRSIKQWPSLGVQTKFTKRATTYLLNIPDLIKVISSWDYEVRSKLPEKSFWFAPLSPETGNFDSSIVEAGEHRNSRANKDLHDWMDRVGLPYHSPHKFRHGHAVYGLTNSKEIADLKAVSQNLMHSNLGITDGIYGMLSTANVGKRIAGLGKLAEAGQVTQSELLDQLTKLTEMVEKSIKHSGTN